MVSQYFGARDRKLLSKAIGNTMVLTLLVGHPDDGRRRAALPGRFWSCWTTPPEIMDMAADYPADHLHRYHRLRFLQHLSGILRGLGDSFMPLVFLLGLFGHEHGAGRLVRGRA